MSETTSFAEPATPVSHFRLYYYAAVLHIVDRLVRQSDSPDAVFERFPFLVGYIDQLASAGLQGVTTSDAHGVWQQRLADWEAGVSTFLPIRALRAAAGLSYATLVAYFWLGLAEEDPRFAAIYETWQGTPGQPHVTYGLLNAWCAELAAVEAYNGTPELHARAVVGQLQAAHLVQVTPSETSRLDAILQVEPLLWSIVSGRGAEGLRQTRSRRHEDGLTYRPPEELVRLDELIVGPELKEQLARIPPLLATGQVETLVVRGPRHNGRATLIGSVAAALGRGVLELPRGGRDEHADLVGPLATLLHALPVAAVELAPGETAQPPRPVAYDGPVGVVMGDHGGLRDAGRVVTLHADLPPRDERLAHWRRALVFGDGADVPAETVESIATRFRLTSGAIYRSADLARAWAALRSDTTGRPGPLGVEDVQQATRTLNRQALDTLAQPVQTGDSTWHDLAVRAETIDELRLLESRCRHRERLAATAAPPGSGPGVGVRALFSGPSGTGKTLATRILASVLSLDLYRVDLSSVVNKYIGETEKNLNELLGRAEELDVILLIDEGDALLTQRTNVQSSTDRYANLETNFLLQRLETYTGIVVVTTNAADRIDAAFQRRMDVVIEFRPPDPAERWTIWQLHLPPSHQVDPALLRQVAERCALNGGQIRNTVLHAAVLALESGGCITSHHFETAVRREYRKTGGVYPMRPIYA